MSKYFVGNTNDMRIPLRDESSVYCLATDLPFSNQSEIDRLIEEVFNDQNLRDFKILDENDNTLTRAGNFTFVNTVNLGGGQASLLEKELISR